MSTSWLSFFLGTLHTTQCGNLPSLTLAVKWLLAVVRNRGSHYLPYRMLGMPQQLQSWLLTLYVLNFS